MFHSHDLFIRLKVFNSYLYLSCDSSTFSERERLIVRNNVLGESQNCLDHPLPIQFFTGGLALYNQLLTTNQINTRLPLPSSIPPPPPNFLLDRYHIDSSANVCNTKDFILVSAALVVHSRDVSCFQTKAIFLNTNRKTQDTRSFNRIQNCLT